MITLIVAMAENRIIGANNGMPWHLPEDLKRFRALTLGHPILMGRKTFEAIGRPLPGRDNVIISRNRDLKPSGVLIFYALSEALEALSDAPQLFVIGGAEIYREALPFAERIELTLIHRSFEGDTEFPPTDPNDWQEVARELAPADPHRDYRWSYLRLERSRNQAPERPPSF